MREDDMLRLSLRCAALAVEGVAYEQILADGVAAILRTDAGTGVTKWGLSESTTVSVEVAVPGVPPLSSAETLAATSVAAHHPTFAGVLQSGPTHRVSDLVTLPDFWDTDLWRIMHGHADGRYPAAAFLRCSRDAAIFVGVHRTRQDFDADDMAILDLVRQPLAPSLTFRAAWQDAIHRCRADVRELARGPLTRREEQVVGLVALGWTSSRIGRHLRISERTVRKHLENVNDKLGTANRAAAVDRWRARGTVIDSLAPKLRSAAR